MRALAIVLVFMYHYMCFVSGQATFGWASVVGWEGVDLFFVLSGYLIANQVFAGVVRGEALSVRAFYLRRAFRTLPVFWLVLAAFLLFPAALGGRPPPPAWRFVTFTQNFGLQPGTAFSHAWSLCVEEQFYLVFPLVVAAGSALAARGLRFAPRARWVLLVGLTAVGLVARAALWRQVDPSHGGDPARYTTVIYYATLCRFDEFVPGIALALLKTFHVPAWRALMARGNALLAIGVAGTLALMAIEWQAVSRPSPSVLLTTFGYTLIALFFACLVAAALSPRTILHRWKIPGAAPVALWSYSLYLTHRPVANVTLHALQAAGAGPAVQVVVISLVCLVAGAAVHRMAEAPFLRWRDRLVPTNFRAGAPSMPAQPTSVRPA